MASFDAVLRGFEKSARDSAKVEVNYRLPTVSITDGAGGVVFLQGADAESFVDDVRDLEEDYQDETREACEYVFAYPYLDLL
ncbi:hypothetical protein [Microbulbifer sp. JMSA002]|uniref:hypothetical protein n=1 Tax=Microbulbifer sp. JMSA002 TaxID=3243368 RepID=UPI00403987B7